MTDVYYHIILIWSLADVMPYGVAPLFNVARGHWCLCMADVIAIFDFFDWCYCLVLIRLADVIASG